MLSISIARDSEGVKLTKKTGKNSADFAPLRNFDEFRELRTVGHVLRSGSCCDLADAG
jgi:hypothetical protein